MAREGRLLSGFVVVVVVWVFGGLGRVFWSIFMDLLGRWLLWLLVWGILSQKKTRLTTVSIIPYVLRSRESLSSPCLSGSAYVCFTDNDQSFELHLAGIG